MVLQHSPWGGYNCRQTAWNSGAQAVEMSAEGTVDPARAFVSLCAQVLVSVGAKRRKIHCDLTVLLLVVGNQWAPHLAC